VRFDAEVPAVIAAVFERLAIGEFTIQLNNRKLMRGFFEGLGVTEARSSSLVLREVDKLDKRGEDACARPWRARASLCPVRDDRLMRILDFVAGAFDIGHADALAKLDALGTGAALFEQGRDELREVWSWSRRWACRVALRLNLSIARGLDYYTGTVYETTLDAYPQIGSICSGGRYENLAGHYTKSKLPGVGISIGLTRLFWQLREPA
jgi:histidyl-tRNA synthetase